MFSESVSSLSSFSSLSTLSRKLSKKQWETFFLDGLWHPKTTFLHGSIRSGKTTIALLLFLRRLYAFRLEKTRRAEETLPRPKAKTPGASLEKTPRNQKKQKEFTEEIFLITGQTQASIQTNVFPILASLLQDFFPDEETSFQLQEDGSISLLGCKVLCRGVAKEDSYKTIRGFDCLGWYANEMTLAHPLSVQEGFYRILRSGFLIADMNPDSPQHPLKIHYIDKSFQASSFLWQDVLAMPRQESVSWSYSLMDNPFIESTQKEWILANTPRGFLFDRNILGKWVGQEGLIYRSFSPEAVLPSSSIDASSFCEFFAGLDFGYVETHPTACVLVAKTMEQKYIVIREWKKAYVSLESTILVLSQWMEEFGAFPIYADTARPDHIATCQKLLHPKWVLPAKKSVLLGIQTISHLFEQKKLFCSDECPALLQEIYEYQWESSGELTPRKKNDDLCDALRYAFTPLYSQKPSLDSLRHFYSR